VKIFAFVKNRRDSYFEISYILLFFNPKIFTFNSGPFQFSRSKIIDSRDTRVFQKSSLRYIENYVSLFKKKISPCKHPNNLSTKYFLTYNLTKHELGKKYLRNEMKIILQQLVLQCISNKPASVTPKRHNQFHLVGIDKDTDITGFSARAVCSVLDRSGILV